jgi:hypothetical protein
MNTFIFKFVIIMGTTLSGIGAMGSAFHDWNELKSVGFLFGACAVLGSSITAAFMDPTKK